MQPATEYPPNHVVTESDGSTTLVRYHFDRRYPMFYEQTQDAMLATANIQQVLAEYGPHTRRRLFDAMLHSREVFGVALDILRVRGTVVCRDGEWRLAS